MSSDLSLILPASVLFLATILFCQQRLAQHLQIKSIFREVQRAEIITTEQKLYELCVQQLEKTQALLESGIDETTAGVRALHHEIASIPFDVLEGIPVTRKASRTVRGIHNLITDGVYSAISVSNRLVGSASRSGIGHSSSTASKDSIEEKPLPDAEQPNDKPE